MGNSTQKLARQGFNGLQSSIGANFNTAITADTTIIIKPDNFFIRRYGPGRANIPAFTAHFTDLGLDCRTLDESPDRSEPANVRTYSDQRRCAYAIQAF